MTWDIGKNSSLTAVDNPMVSQLPVLSVVNVNDSHLKRHLRNSLNIKAIVVTKTGVLGK